jgi:hypothetical protein
VMSFHLWCIGRLHATPDEGRGELEMPRAFRALQLRRLNSRMSWNVAGLGFLAQHE